MKNLIYLLFVLLLLGSGCSGRSGDPRLIEIADKVSDSPKEMLSLLDSIDVGSMKDNDRHYHALLRIKAQDKAFVRHTSDSVILKVIDYYSRHKESGLYPEALYYGGRVYSDLGDAPTAIRYYQDALDILPENADNVFRATILTQTGWLLNSVRIHSEAASYVLEAIKIRPTDRDSLKRMYDIEFLGAIYMHLHEYDRADSCLNASLRISRNLSHEDSVLSIMYLAKIELERGNFDAALKKIQTATSHLPTRRQDIIKAYASEIYLKCGIPDSAYYYSQLLTKSKNNDFRINGYSMLISPELRKYSTIDSLLSYTISYGGVLDKYFDKHDGQQISFQTSLFNYQRHEKEKLKAENSKRIYLHIAVFAIIVGLILCIMLLRLRISKMHTLLQFHKAIDDLEELRKKLSLDDNMNTLINRTLPNEHDDNQTDSIKPQKKVSEDSEEEQIEVYNVEDEDLSDEEKNKNELRERLKMELLALQKEGKAKKGVPPVVASSSLYSKILDYIKAGQCIDDLNPIWLEMEDLVLQLSPEFKLRLYLLAGDKLKKDAYHMALLIRIGITPKQLTVLTGRSKGAVSSRRGNLCEKIFGKKYGASVMDDIIRLL